MSFRKIVDEIMPIIIAIEFQIQMIMINKVSHLSFKRVTIHLHILPAHGRLRVLNRHECYKPCRTINLTDETEGVLLIARSTDGCSKRATSCAAASHRFVIRIQITRAHSQGQ